MHRGFARIIENQPVARVSASNFVDASAFLAAPESITYNSMYFYFTVSGYRIQDHPQFSVFHNFSR